MSTNLGDLLKKAGFAPSAEPVSAGPAEPDVPEEPGARFARKVVLRITRAGRGGKQVTTIDGVLRDPDELARSLRKQLGVGVTVDGEQLVVQGDQASRLEPILREAGAKTVVRG